MTQLLASLNLLRTEAEAQGDDRARGALQAIIVLLPPARLPEAREALLLLLDPVARERVERLDLGK